MPELAEILAELAERLSRIEAALNGNNGTRFEKEWYTVAEAADVLGKAPFTVREWCRHDRINATKRNTGRGRALEWMISHQEIERIINKGLLPARM
jgi:hypothetical protein